MGEDTMEIQMAGCRVSLTYRQVADSGWTVVGIVRSGVGDNMDEQRVATGSFPTREAAEADALNRVTQLLGNNVDRSSSPVKNYS
jgi:hypothetical protein